MSKLNLETAQTKLKPLLTFLKKDSVAIFLVISAAIFGFLIWRIGVLANAEPSQSALDEKLQSVVRPSIDQDSIKVIENLRTQNIDINTFFSGRDNPFQE